MVGLADVIAIVSLVFLEGLLSLDNALVLAVLVRGLPPHQRQRALTYGMAGAFGFRVLAVLLVSFLMKWWWLKFIGGAYLLYIAIKHWTSGEDYNAPDTQWVNASFWRVIVVVELTDIAFSADSILAAMAVSNKAWVIIVGGILGIVAMRFAATQFVKLLDRFPRLEATAYHLVALIGTKLVIDSFHFRGIDFHSSDNVAFWAFWIGMLGCVLNGLRTHNRKDSINAAPDLDNPPASA